MRRILGEDQMTEGARKRVGEYHRSIVDEVVGAIEEHGVVVVGMAQNPHVKRARNALNEAGIEFHYLEYGSYLKAWRKRLAIKMWTGWPTFPQVFVAGVLIGGADETQAAIEDGSLQRMLEAA
jgi:glutaredoxin-related protein